jgi:hypothetical protein
MSEQDDLAAFKGNDCVGCHSKASTAASLSNRYLEWHLSKHKESAVGCEKCHGGDPTTGDKARAHAGVFPASNPKSRIHPTNLPDTCGACHKQVVAAFVQSVHHQKLKANAAAPSCNTCHAHMGNAVVAFPAETSALCAQCHSKQPEIPQKAGQVMEAIDRANGIVIWADRLLDAGREKKLDLKAEDAEMKAVRAALAEAKADWHTFGLDPVQKKADDAFLKGTQAKDALMKRLGFAK